MCHPFIVMFQFRAAGGWGGCQYYSQVMKSSNQAQFVAAVVDAVKKYDLDGTPVTQRPLVFALMHQIIVRY